MQSITHPDDWERGEMHTLGHRLADAYRMEQRYIRRDQSVMWAAHVGDGDGRRTRAAALAITHIEDITEQRHSAERLEWAATHDELTGLPNRFRFLDQLARFLETQRAGRRRGDVHRPRQLQGHQRQPRARRRRRAAAGR